MQLVCRDNRFDRRIFGGVWGAGEIHPDGHRIYDPNTSLAVPASHSTGSPSGFGQYRPVK
jgi:hypothetical protein